MTKKRTNKAEASMPRRTLMDFLPTDPPTCLPGYSLGDPVVLLRDFKVWGFENDGRGGVKTGWITGNKAGEIGVYAGQRGIIGLIDQLDHSIIKLKNRTCYMIEGVDFRRAKAGEDQ